MLLSVSSLYLLLQVPAYLKRNKQQITLEQQQLEQYLRLGEQPVSSGSSSSSRNSSSRNSSTDVTSSSSACFEATVSGPAKASARQHHHGSMRVSTGNRKCLSASKSVHGALGRRALCPNNSNHSTCTTAC
jgi:hypothetical protein